MTGASMASAMRLPKAFDIYKPVLESELRTALSDNNLPLYDMLRYHMGWLDESGRPTDGLWGKGLRSMMCLFSCEVVGGDWQRALSAAVALELVHNFSLIHDDIQDGDIERRHRPTLWSIWGRAMGLLAGNSMRLHADSTMLNSLSSNVPPDRLIQALVKFLKLTAGPEKKS